MQLIMIAGWFDFQPYFLYYKWWIGAGLQTQEAAKAQSRTRSSSLPGPLPLPLPRVMMLPDCHDVFSEEGSLLLCARSLSFGSFCLATLTAAVYGFQRILPIFLRSQWYITNLCMLALTVLQMALLAYECLVQNSPRILVLVKYFRGIQVAISCVLYGKSAGEVVNRSRLLYNALVPIVGITTVAMTVDATLVVAMEGEIDCHHFTWLAMSVMGVILTVGFAIPGRVVLEDIKSASRLQREKFLASGSASLTELEQSHHQLWTLLICNLVSSSLQFFVDAYLSFGVAGTRACDSLFFREESGVFEQTVRLALAVATYLLPNWATVYVFYVLPRFQFSTGLDVPGLDMPTLERDEDTGAQGVYALLPTDDQVESSRKERL